MGAGGAPGLERLDELTAATSDPGHLQTDREGSPSPRSARHEPDRLYGHVKANKKRTTFLEFCRYLRSLYPPGVRIAIVMHNFSLHLSMRNDGRVGEWVVANNVELAYVPTNASYLNRIECHFTALRYFARNGTDHQDHGEQNSMFRRYIAWRTRQADNEKLRAVSLYAKVA
jgi:hypothetical protein